MTKLKQIAFLFFALLFAHTINAQTAEKTSDAFIGVKQVYVEDNTSDTLKEKSIATFLQTELTRRGFVIVDKKENADAILLGEVQAEVSLDGDSSNPPDKAIYRYRLLSPDNKLLWKATIKFVAKSSLTENDIFAAQKLAGKLSSDWQKAKKLADK